MGGGHSQQKFTNRWVETCIYLQRGAVLIRFWNIYSIVLLGAAVFAVFSLLSHQKRVLSSSWGCHHCAVGGAGSSLSLQAHRQNAAPTTVRSNVWLNFTKVDVASVRCHKCSRSSAFQKPFWRSGEGASFVHRWRKAHTAELEFHLSFPHPPCVCHIIYMDEWLRVTIRLFSVRYGTVTHSVRNGCRGFTVLVSECSEHPLYGRQFWPL